MAAMGRVKLGGGEVESRRPWSGGRERSGNRFVEVESRSVALLGDVERLFVVV